MVKEYFAVFHPEENDAYSVYFPGIEGAYTCGDNLGHAKEMAFDVLGLVLDTLYEAGSSIDWLPEQPDVLGNKGMFVEDGDFIETIVFDTEKYRKKVKEQNMVIDGTKLKLGFTFEGHTPVIKTEPEFTQKKKLQGRDDFILRYAALLIITQLYDYVDEAYEVDWATIDSNNYIANDTLVINNGYGEICANGYTLSHLYLTERGNIMAIVSHEENGIDYDVLIG